MTNKLSKTRRAKMNLLDKARWAGYAAAGAATLLGAEPAEAEIIYRKFDPAVYLEGGSPFLLDVNDDGVADLTFLHEQWTSEGVNFGAAFVSSLGDAQIAGFVSNEFGYPFAYNLTPGTEDEHLVNGRNFQSVGTMAYGAGTLASQFLEAGPGYVGFSFDTAAGTQYGWLQVNMTGTPLNAFSLIDYAYAGVGEEIHVGEVPEPGSLGLLATGALGLLLWRRCRRHSDRAMA